MSNTPYSQSLSGIVFLILAQMMVGINIVASKLLIPNISAFVLLEMRFGLAAILLLILHYLHRGKKASKVNPLRTLTSRDWFFILAQALSAGFLFNVLMLMGLHYTGANEAAIITSTLPAIIAVLSWVLLRERVGGKQSFSIILATLGLLVIAYDKLTPSQGYHSFFGDFLIVVSLLPEAAYYVLCKLHPNKLPVFLISALMNGINAIVILPIALSLAPHVPDLGIDAWLIIFLLGLSSGLFYVFWFFGYQQVDSTMASLSTTVMPVATVLFAWAILGERLTLTQSFGMLLVLFSIVAYARK
ncbi:DMT family transporter [Legionella jordanis]|uniref:Transmembrane protein n=1 Tax=Legionella jordanis TaxID=456 RepID=A0A0W0V7Z7_9GAMM|nr:DMT family transporter [Legionella jordanis]KTD16240.1 transmembrane protein [Legionella jordanis]VEH12302.1 transmembrane protein [Legionella jordanis]